MYGLGLDDPILLRSNDKHYYYLKDIRSSVFALYDEQAQLVEQYRYSSFGNYSIFNAEGDELNQSQVGNPYGFTSRRWDQETQLWNYRNRIYSSTLGRFLQRDPAGYVDGLNLYAYVKNNPLKYTDAMGLTSQSVNEEQFNSPIISLYTS